MFLKAKDEAAGGYQGSMDPRGDGEEIALLHFPLSIKSAAYLVGEDKFSQL